MNADQRKWRQTLISSFSGRRFVWVEQLDSMWQTVWRGQRNATKDVHWTKADMRGKTVRSKHEDCGGKRLLLLPRYRRTLVNVTRRCFPCVTSPLLFLNQSRLADSEHRKNSNHRKKIPPDLRLAAFQARVKRIIITTFRKGIPHRWKFLPHQYGFAYVFQTSTAKHHSQSIN